MRRLHVFRNIAWAGIALLVSSFFEYSFASWSQEDQSGGGKPSASEQSAIARVNGRTLTIFPKGGTAQSRDLSDEYLFAWAGSKGNSIAGWGFGGPNSDHSSRAGAQIFTLLNYGRNREIIEGFRDPLYISISPDSKRLALIAVNKATHFRGLQIVEIDGAHRAEQAVQVEGQTSEMDPYVAWSPEGAQLLFAVGDHIQLFDTESGKKEVLVSGTLPSWSMDGRLLAFFATDFHLAVMDLGTRHSTLISSPHRTESRASWAPDSSRFIVEQDWGSKDKHKNCPTNSRLVEYRWPSLKATPVLDPCGLKPELFFWVDDWKQWLRN